MASCSLIEDKRVRRGQASLYRLLKEKLPGATLVSIGRREGLAEFHARRFASQDLNRG